MEQNQESHANVHRAKTHQHNLRGVAIVTNGQWSLNAIIQMVWGNAKLTLLP